MLMLLSMYVTSVLFLVRFNNFALLLELHALTLVAHSYALLTEVSTRETSTKYLSASDKQAMSVGMRLSICAHASPLM